MPEHLIVVKVLCFTRQAHAAQVDGEVLALRSRSRRTCGEKEETHRDRPSAFPALSVKRTSNAGFAHYRPPLTSTLTARMYAVPAVQFDDLLAAFDWVGAQPLDNAAYVSRRTGQVHWVSEAMELEEEPPVDVGDTSVYVLLPSKSDLWLGRSLAQDFTREHLPNSYGQVAAFFRHRGAYSKFKDLLSHNGLLDAWHAHEAAEVERALRAWAAEEGLDIEQSANLRFELDTPNRHEVHARGVSALR